uniref:Uncharacterized protein n=1 Tax=Anopheles atroparvus TaxID=41427 RepID=A0AAG5DRN8_ANOAO
MMPLFSGNPCACFLIISPHFRRIFAPMVLFRWREAMMLAFRLPGGGSVTELAGDGVLLQVHCTHIHAYTHTHTTGLHAHPCTSWWFSASLCLGLKIALLHNAIPPHGGAHQLGGLSRSRRATTC